MENKLLVPVPAELLAAIFNYLGTKPAQEVEGLRHGLREADAAFAQQARKEVEAVAPPEECMPG